MVEKQQSLCDDLIKLHGLLRRNDVVNSSHGNVITSVIQWRILSTLRTTETIWQSQALPVVIASVDSGMFSTECVRVVYNHTCHFYSKRPVTHFCLWDRIPFRTMKILQSAIFANHLINRSWVI
ncbi:hypothetical protein AHF37_11047 [Paragonimus kellicotti]|nr:hypothetical protein AHF37_11047 [Paragonimus kellicotti]